MITQEGLTAQQAEFFDQNGYLVLPEFVEAQACLKLRDQAMILAEKYCPSPEQATVFTADGTAVHASDDYFLTSGDKIRCFFEKDAFNERGELRQNAHLCLNKLGHAMHDLDPVFREFSHSSRLAAVARSIGLQHEKLLQSMYIFKQPRIGGEVTSHVDHTYLWTDPQSVIGFGSQLTTQQHRTVACGHFLVVTVCRLNLEIAYPKTASRHTTKFLIRLRIPLKVSYHSKRHAEP